MASNALNVSKNGIGNGTLAAADPDGDALTFSLVANGTNGTATITDPATGAFSYVPNAGFAGTNTSYDLILNVSVPIYDRGIRYAQKHEDEAKLQQAMANLASARARSKANWEAARANVIAAQAVLDQAEAQARVAKRAQEQIDVSARAGVATSLDLQVADQNLFQAQSAAAQARANLDVRRAEVAAAEGRLYADLAR